MVVITITKVGALSKDAYFTLGLCIGSSPRASFQNPNPNRAKEREKKSRVAKIPFWSLNLCAVLARKSIIALSWRKLCTPPLPSYHHCCASCLHTFCYSLRCKTKQKGEELGSTGHCVCPVAIRFFPVDWLIDIEHLFSFATFNKLFVDQINPPVVIIHWRSFRPCWSNNTNDVPTPFKRCCQGDEIVWVDPG